MQGVAVGVETKYNAGTNQLKSLHVATQYARGNFSILGYSNDIRVPDRGAATHQCGVMYHLKLDRAALKAAEVAAEVEYDVLSKADNGMCVFFLLCLCVCLLSFYPLVFYFSYVLCRHAFIPADLFCVDVTVARGVGPILCENIPPSVSLFLSVTVALGLGWNPADNVRVQAKADSRGAATLIASHSLNANTKLRAGVELSYDNLSLKKNFLELAFFD